MKEGRTNEGSLTVKSGGRGPLSEIFSRHTLQKWAANYNLSNPSAIQVSAPTNNAQEGEVDWLYDDLQDLLKPTPINVLFIIGDQNAKVGSQEIPGVTDKSGLEVQNEAGQRLKEFCQENALVIPNTLFQQHKKTTLHMDITR